MLTPLAPCQTKGTDSALLPAARWKSRWLASGTKPASCVGAAPVLLTQPLCASKKCSASSANRRTGALPGSVDCGYFNRSALWIAPPSRVRRRTSVVTVTVGTASAATASGVALIVAALGAAGTSGSAGTSAPLTLGTVLAALAAGAVTGVAACSLLQAIHNRVATINQAKI